MAAKVSVPVDLMSAVGMLLLMMGTSCAYDFYVGGGDGWVEKPSENFNDWAARNRFQVNDKLVFRYKKGEDSVLVVSEADYRSCITSNPIRRLDGGDSVLQFDRSGPFFFISGTPGRCQSGQKLIVVVLAVRNPKPTPSPNPGAATPAPLPSPPTSSPLPSPPTAAPTPSPKAAAAPTPSPSTAHAPSPSTSAAPTPSSSLPSPAPSPSGQSAAPSPSESVPSPSLAPPADQVPEPSPAAPGPSTSNSSSSTPPPSSSSYTGASLWTVAVAWALCAVTFLVY
ncbi:hypothetical protein Taro_013597 [Colocasia esculenta]|uniref:Phytocyanin domain-containing protein n=1 Tax=Colocasia esculenta TaxID=4460 RepID=A0A843UJ93_COLES|nr:hypothetical protein [Colocasia esculenta]